MQPNDPILAASAILPAGEADEPLESWEADEAFAAFEAGVRSKRAADQVGRHQGRMNDRPAALGYLAPVFRVSDLARSIRFYREQLGFELDFAYDDFYACVHRDGCYIHLKCASPAPRDQAAFERTEHLDACAVISAVARLAGEFAAAGAPFCVPLRTMPYGVEFYVRDPDGYIIGFVQPAT